MRTAAALLLASAALLAAPAGRPRPEFVQAVEFPYYLYPHTQWERELVWLKGIGVRTVAFSIPWNWHQVAPEDFDLTGRTSPRRDLGRLIRVLRKLDLEAWVRPLPPLKGWPNEGWPQGMAAGSPDSRQQRAWLGALEALLAPQTTRHGGPVAYVEGRALAIDAAAPPPGVTVISATDALALVRSRTALAAAVKAGSGALLWGDVEDSVYPAGTGAPLAKGAVGLSGSERVNTAPLRRSAALLRSWTPLLGGLRHLPMPKQAPGQFPETLQAVEMVSAPASAVSLSNTGKETFQGDIRVVEPSTRRTLVIPHVAVPAGESLWLPLHVSIGPGGMCRECTNFSAAEHIVYATAELISLEYENGILAMEFAAPERGELILQLAREPVGPFLAGGAPAEFDWDEKAFRARLSIPAGKGPGNRVRVGIAIEAPETSAFFDETRRLISGQKNLLSTTYSSAKVAARSRLRMPEGFIATPHEKAPNEIDYEVSVPADALHGDWANFALEADGVALGRARLQVFRPVSVRMPQAIALHFGAETELAPEIPTVAMEARTGGNLDFVLRNNWPQIVTYQIEASGAGLEFMQAKTELAVGAIDERRFSLRVFPGGALEGLQEWKLRVSAPERGTLELPVRLVLVPRGKTVAWSADLDGDGTPEWVLESHRARAVFSTEDGGRWREFTWKDTGANFLPEQGAFAGTGHVEVRAEGNTLIFTGQGWRRTVRLDAATLDIDQTGPLVPDGLNPEKRSNVSFSISRPSPTHSTYALQQ